MLRPYRFQAGRKPTLFVILVLTLLTGCTVSPTPISIAKDVPLLIDDGKRSSLIEALQHQQHTIRGHHRDKVLNLGGRIYTDAMLEESLAAFAEILEMKLPPLEQDRLIKNHFSIFQADGRPASKNKEMLVTGYFEPVLDGSLTRAPPFIYPLYTLPADLKVTTTADGKKVTGRIAAEADNVFKPYWTREEIDGSTILQGYELVYLKDRFDAFLLHVQGSGKVVLRNGEIRSIRYAGNNGHPYSSIGKLLVDEKKLDLADADISAIRSYLSSDANEMTRVLNHNRRYIFFDWGAAGSPQGSSGAPLTAERSIAIDGKVLPMKTIAFLSTQRPILDKDGRISRWVPMNRFVFPQDTGAAIKGSGRVDLYWGSGDFAEKAAGAMKHPGKLYFLIKKDAGENQ